MAYDRWSVEGRTGDALDRIECAHDTVLGAALVPFVLALVLIDKLLQR